MTYLEKAIQVSKELNIEEPVNIVTERCPDNYFKTTIDTRKCCKEIGCRECWNRLYEDEDVRDISSGTKLRNVYNGD